MKGKGNAEVDVGVTWQRLVALAQDYVKDWVSYNPKQVRDNEKQFIKKHPTRCINVSNFIVPYLYEAQHVSGDTPPIITSLKLHWQPLVFHTWKVVGRVVGGRYQAQCA